MDKININNFDFLRVLFASVVALAHLIELSQVKIFQPYSLYFNTRLAIDGFFIISGFLIAKSYENSKGLKEYMIKRIKRIVPAYFFLILFCAFLFSLITTNSFVNYFSNAQFWNYLLANLSFQNYIEPCLPGVFENNKICAVNGALWTIKIEEAFYLLVPLFYYLINFKKVNIYILSILVYLISICYFNYFSYVDMYKVAKQLPGALAFFITGVIFYRNFYLLLKWRHHAILICLLLFFLEQYIFKTQILKPITYGFMVFYLAYNFKWLNNFGKYGDFTYGIYIYHFPVIQLFVYFELFNKYNPIVISLLVLLVVFVLSVISWYMLELRYLSNSRKLRHKRLSFINKNI